MKESHHISVFNGKVEVRNSCTMIDFYRTVTPNTEITGVYDENRKAPSPAPIKRFHYVKKRA